MISLVRRVPIFNTGFGAWTFIFVCFIKTSKIVIIVVAGLIQFLLYIVFMDLLIFYENNIIMPKYPLHTS